VDKNAGRNNRDSNPVDFLRRIPKAENDPQAVMSNARRNRYKVGARTGAEILVYESGEDDLLVSVLLWKYSKIGSLPDRSNSL
jgi:hypothetical protein